MVRDRNLNITREMLAGRGAQEFIYIDWFYFDTAHTLCYSVADLESAKTDLVQVGDALRILEFYLQPQSFCTIAPKFKEFTDDQIRALLLRQLNEKRLFREALDRICADQRSTPQ